MPDSTTNRDLYLAATAMCGRHRGSGRTLEEYLRALWRLGSEMRDQPALSGSELIRLLAQAWDAPAPLFDDGWRRMELAAGEPEGFGAWEEQILRQVVDLREMDEAGTFDHDMIYFGVDAPSGARWYNFHPTGYLEAAVEGTFGGWQPGDAERVQVTGPVAVIGPDGTIISVDASEIDHPVVPLGAITWERFADFLYWGQNYE